MRPLSLVAIVTLLLLFCVHEYMHRYTVVPTGDGKAFIVDQFTGKVRILMGVASMPVAEYPSR